MLKSTRAANGEMVIKLSGRMGAENLGEVEKISAESDGRRIVLDLKDLKLVDQDAVSFLKRCEGRASRSKISQHTSASGSQENGDEHRNQNGN